MKVRKDISTDDIGQVGQKLVCMLASSVGATPNESSNDRMGWDILLQFEFDDDSSGPLDQAPPQRTCWLQVKTTTAKRKSWALKLTNWQKMIRDPTPWFVVLVHLGENNAPRSVHVAHIDEKWTSIALKDLRIASKKGATAANRIKLPVSWSEADALPEISGSALLARIDAAIGDDYERYLRDKAERYRSIGYNGPRRSLSLSVRKADEAWMKDMADLAVGLRRVVPGEWTATTHDLRFGIPHETRTFDRTSGDMTIAVKGRGILRLRVESEAPWPAVEVVCELFRARNAFRFLPEGVDKFRIGSKHISLVIPCGTFDGHHQQRSFKASLPFSDPVPLVDVEQTAWIVHHLTNPRGVTLTISSEDGRSSVTRQHFQIPSEPDLKNFRLFESVSWVCRAFGLADDAALDLDLAVQQRDHFEFMEKALRSPFTPVSFTSSKELIAVSERFGVVGVVSAQAGQLVLFAVYGAHGAATSCERAGDGWTTQAEEVSLVCDKYTVPIAQHDGFDVSDAIQKMRSKLEGLGIGHIFLDPAARPHVRSGEQ